MIQSSQKSIFMEPCTVVETRRLLTSLPNKGSCGIDRINNILLKKLSNEIAVPLNYIVNSSMEQGIFPDIMKCALVVPLYKAKSREEVTNYRPISLLMTLSKVIEKVVYKRVYNYLHSTGQLYDSQYGFRNNHSCEHAIGELLGNIVKNQQLGKDTVSIMLDLSKAFDTLQHSVIFKKLEKYGIRGPALAWFKSYLTDRTLCVKCSDQNGDNYISEKHKVLYGAPQGSCMGPLIFLVFCNDLHLHLQFMDSIQFADDTTMYLGHSNLNYLRFCLETDMLNISDWFCANKLTLNIEKTVVLHFTRKSSKCKRLESIEIGPLKLKVATLAKFLGLWIDENLNWKEHVRRLLLKINSKKAMLCKGKNLLTTHAKKILYFAQIQSNLTYGLLIWGNMISSADKHKLEALQNKCVKLIDQNKTTTEIYNTYKILMLTELVELENYKTWYKHHNNLLPTKFSKIMSEDHKGGKLLKSHTYSTRRKNELNLPLATHTNYYSSFLVTGLSEYTSLPIDLKKEVKFHRFVSKCKQYLIQKRSLVN